MQETFFPSIRLGEVVVSYHCSISVALALLLIPRVSYIFCNSSLIFFTGIGVCFGNLLSAISTIFKSVSTFDIAVRASFMLPGFVSPFLQDLLLNHLGQKVRNLQSKLICPKCRRQLSKDDIINREHPYCKAH